MPDHTRNDPHVIGSDLSPYEGYTNQYTRANLDIAKGLKASGAISESEPTVQDYIKSTAQYTNSHFFSKDTINDPEYTYPKIVRTDDNFGYGLDENGKEFPLVRAEKIVNSSDRSVKTTYSLESTENFYPILQIYFDHLSRRAVLAGAGATNLFLTQAKKEKADWAVNKDYQVYASNKDVVNAFSVPGVSFVGEFAKVYGAVQGGVSHLMGSLGNLLRKDISISPPPAALVAVSPASPALAPPPSSEPPAALSQAVAKTDIGTTTQPADETAAPRVLGAAIVSSSAASSPSIQSSSPAAAPSGVSELPASPATPVPPPMAINPIPGNGGTSFTPAPPAPAHVVDSEPTDTSASSSDISEPAPPPPPPQTVLKAAFVRSAMQADFSWDPVSVSPPLEGDGIGSDSSSTPPAEAAPVYALYDVSAEPAVLIATTTATSASQAIREVGRDYKYALRLAGSDGSEIALATAALSVPSLIDRAHFYADPRASSTYVLDLFYGERPFVPEIFDAPSVKGSYQAMVTYFDRDANPANSGFAVRNNVLQCPADLAGIPFGCSTVWSLNPLLSRGIGSDALQHSTFPLPEEDGHLALSFATDTVFSASDYLTFGYYTMSNYGGYGGGDPAFKLVAVDREKIYFGERPAQSPPTMPGAPQIGFDGLHLSLSASWTTSTDPDSPDSSIAYEFNYSTSTLDDSAWQSTGRTAGINIPKAEFPDTYTFAVRAVDDFGNVSDLAQTVWHFPEGFTPPVITGGVNSASQDFVMPRDATATSLDIATLDYGRNGGFDDVCHADLYEIAEDGKASLLAPSDSDLHSIYCAGNPVTFTYASPVPLLEGHVYRWLFRFNTAPSPFPDMPLSTIKFAGLQTNTVGGTFGDSEIVNAKFLLHFDDGSTFGTI